MPIQNDDIQAAINLDCPFTHFPTVADSVDRKIDVTLELLDDVQKYYTLIDGGKFEEIEQLLIDNPKLAQCVITAKDFNVLRDGMVAIQRWALSYLGDYLVNFSKPKGTWNKNVKYEKYNVVTYTVDKAVQTYIAFPKSQTTLDIPIGSLPTDDNYWTCITLRGEKGESGTGMTPRGMHQLGVQYYKDDLVAYDNAFWYAAQDNIDQVPNKASSSWHLMMVFSSDLLIFENSNSNLSATTVQDAIIELSRKTKCIKNVTIPAGSFTNKVYTYTNNNILSGYEPRVNFTEDSIPIALKAGVIVRTYDGYMTFKVKKLPTTDLKIETIMLTATF